MTDTTAPQAYLVSGKRTPVGRYGGALSSVRPDDLAALTLKAVIEDAGLDPSVVDEVILGNANGAGEENRNVARMAWLLAGFPDTVPGITVNRLRLRHERHRARHRDCAVRPARGHRRRRRRVHFPRTVGDGKAHHDFRQAGGRASTPPSAGAS